MVIVVMFTNLANELGPHPVSHHCITLLLLPVCLGKYSDPAIPDGDMW